MSLVRWPVPRPVSIQPAASQIITPSGPVGVNGSLPGGVVVRRIFIRSVVGGITQAVITGIPGSQPGGVVVRRRPARAAVGSNASPGDGFSGIAVSPISGQLPPGGITVKRRSAARAVVGNSSQSGDGISSTAQYNGSLPGGLIIRRIQVRAVIFGRAIQTTITAVAGSQPGGIVRRRSAARAVIASITGRAFFNGSQPGGVVYRRRPARAVFAGIAVAPIIAHAAVGGTAVTQRPASLHTRAVTRSITGRAFYNGRQPGGVVYRRRPARAVLGNSGLTGDGFAGLAFPNGHQPGGVVYRRRPARAVTASITGHAFPNGHLPPLSGIAVKRRTTARAITAHIYAPVVSIGSGSIQPLATRQPRRASARSYAFWIPVRTVNAQTAGTVQRRATIPVPRRYQTRAWWSGWTSTSSYYPTAYTAAYPSLTISVNAGSAWASVTVNLGNAPPPGSIQPLATRQPRRTSARAVITSVLGKINAQTAGTIQPRATVPVPRRYQARAVWAGSSARELGKFPPPVGAQPDGAVYRRKPARAFTHWIPVQTVNAQTAGTIQPRATVAVPRRYQARAVWATNVIVRTVNAAPGIPAPPQLQPIPRRYPSRAVWAGSSTRELGKFPPPSGQLPPGGITVKRRTTSRAVWATITQTRGPSGRIQPRATIAIPRRYQSRAVWAGSSARELGKFPPPSGKIQPRGSVPVPRRASYRLVAAKVIAPFPAPQGSQPGGLVKRRSPARAVPLWEVAHGSLPQFFPPPQFFPAQVTISPVNQNAASVVVSTTLVQTTINVSVKSVQINPVAYSIVNVSPMGANQSTVIMTEEGVIPVTLVGTPPPSVSLGNSATEVMFSPSAVTLWVTGATIVINPSPMRG